MKKSITILTILTILFSCKDSKTKQNTEKTTTPIIEEKTTTPEKTQKSEQKEAEVQKTDGEIEKEERVEEKGVFIPEKQLKSIILDFQNCKEISEKRSDCRNKLTAFISKAYKANEFKNAEQQYVIYDSIQPIISRSSKWKNLGTAIDQSVIDKAVVHANKGKLALVIDTSQTYGHIVVIAPGSTKKSGSWGIKLPNVVSLLNRKASKSFYNKSMAYAFKKSNDLQIYIRE